ncbi:protein NLP7-like isoform X2 [Apium graveolens]|uniref:protein NLP7-like isoform X2 n=1 Tax=Apium graveolens TaxID=4045 RepID=UPI003D7BB6BD
MATSFVNDETQPWSRHNVLFQIWEASSERFEDGRRYWELVARKEPFYVLFNDDKGFSSYRIHSLASSITIQEDQEEHGKEAGVITRVFLNNRPEMSPNISYYSLQEHPQRDFALSCGIRASLCLPLFKTINFSGCPDGVMELVSTCDQHLEKVKLSVHLSCFFKKLRMFSLGDNIYRFIRTNVSKIPKHALLEMDHMLKEMCQTFHLPLAQYWVTKDPNLGALDVMYQSSCRDFENSMPWCEFKDACVRMGSNIGEGLVGKTYLSQKSFFCKDVRELTITDHPSAHYARKCGSIAYITIYLWSLSPQCRDCVLEFFLPNPEMNSTYPQTLLNSLLATTKENLPYFMVASEGQSGQVLSVEVINPSRHEPKTFKIGQPLCSLAHHEGPQNKGDASQPASRRSNLWFQDEIVQDEHGLDIKNKKSNTTIVPYHDALSGDLTIATPEIIEEDNSAMKHKEHTMGSERAQPSRLEDVLQIQNSGIINFEIIGEFFGIPQEDAAKSFAGDVVKELPVQDAGYAMNANTRSSNFQTEKSSSLQEFIEIEKDLLILDHSHQLPVVEDSIHKKGLIGGTENYDSCIHVLDKTCIEETSKEGKSPEKGYSYDILSAHFGKLQDDAAKYFNVSRSTFKRICRDNGIKRWRSHGKKLDSQSSPELRRANNEEPSRNKSSFSGIFPLQDTDMITVKATYNEVAIKFEVLDSSGIVDLEDNVIERLKIERNTFSIKYQDDDGDWVLIACDKDVQKCIKTSRLLKKTTIKMLVDRPITHYRS